MASRLPLPPRRAAWGLLAPGPPAARTTMCPLGSPRSWVCPLSNSGSDLHCDPRAQEGRLMNAGCPLAVPLTPMSLETVPPQCWALIAPLGSVALLDYSITQGTECQGREGTRIQTGRPRAWGLQHRKGHRTQRRVSQDLFSIWAIKKIMIASPRIGELAYDDKQPQSQWINDVVCFLGHLLTAGHLGVLLQVILLQDAG